jgi:hypothetical protein
MDMTDDDVTLLAAFKAECDAVGIPYDPPGLVRHHRGNAGLAAAMEGASAAFVAEGERDSLEQRIKGLHQRRWAGHGPDKGLDKGAFCEHCSKIRDDYVSWPCPTIVAVWAEPSAASDATTPAESGGNP